MVACTMLFAHTNGAIFLELRALMAHLAIWASASFQAMVWNRYNSHIRNINIALAQEGGIQITETLLWPAGFD